MRTITCLYVVFCLCFQTLTAYQAHYVCTNSQMAGNLVHWCQALIRFYCSMAQEDPDTTKSRLKRFFSSRMYVQPNSSKVYCVYFPTTFLAHPYSWLMALVVRGYQGTPLITKEVICLNKVECRYNEITHNKGLLMAIKNLVLVHQREDCFKERTASL